MLTIECIRKAVLPIAEKYRVKKIDLFGSLANGTATEISDADFLVTFQENEPSIFEVMGFREELKNHLNIPVDIITLPLSKPDKIYINKVITIYEQS